MMMETMRMIHRYDRADADDTWVYGRGNMIIEKKMMIPGYDGEDEKRMILGIWQRKSMTMENMIMMPGYEGVGEDNTW
jgi:hypothetical protein